MRKRAKLKVSPSQNQIWAFTWKGGRWVNAGSDPVSIWGTVEKAIVSRRSFWESLGYSVEVER